MPLRSSLVALATTTFSAAAVTALAALAGCSAAPSEDAASDDNASGALSTSSYSPSAAVAYATAHWDDGVGECAEFVSHSLRAGHLNISVITWVPTLYQALAKVAYDEHDDPTDDDSATANAGDVVMFSDASGAGFCDVNTSDEGNCGHVCLVTVAGTSSGSIKVDCHNNAHHEIAITGILGGTYSTYRVYHLSTAAKSTPKPAATMACSSDDDCNGGASGTATVCAASEHYCIAGCHSDDDCPGNERCEATSPHWSCH